MAARWCTKIMQQNMIVHHCSRVRWGRASVSTAACLPSPTLHTVSRLLDVKKKNHLLKEQQRQKRKLAPTRKHTFLRTGPARFSPAAPLLPPPPPTARRVPLAPPPTPASPPAVVFAHPPPSLSVLRCSAFFAAAGTRACPMLTSLSASASVAVGARPTCSPGSSSSSSSSSPTLVPTVAPAGGSDGGTAVFSGPRGVGVGEVALLLSRVLFARDLFWAPPAPLWNTTKTKSNRKRIGTRHNCCQFSFSGRFAVFSSFSA